MGFLEGLWRVVRGFFAPASEPAPPDGDAAGYDLGVKHASEHGADAAQMMAEVVASQFGKRHTSEDFLRLSSDQKDRYAAARLWIAVLATRANGPDAKFLSATDRGIDLLIERWPAPDRPQFQSFLGTCFNELDPLVRMHRNDSGKVVSSAVLWIVGPAGQNLSIWMLAEFLGHFIWMRGYARGCLSKLP